MKCSIMAVLVGLSLMPATQKGKSPQPTAARLVRASVSLTGRKHCSHPTLPSLQQSWDTSGCCHETAHITGSMKTHLQNLARAISPTTRTLHVPPFCKTDH